jgi:hypothetical protein
MWHKRVWILTCVVLVGLVFGASIIIPGSAAPSLAPAGTAFTYQGYLEDEETPANGTYTLCFSLWTDSSFAAQVGGDITLVGVPITDGLFTVELDFGDVFDGTALWLEIEVQGPGDLDYTILSPRQPLTPVPYAINADRLDGLEAVAFASYLHDHAGESWAAGDVASGLSVSSTSSSGSGLTGINSASSGNAYGVYGEAQSVSGAGVYGVNNASPGPLAFGVLGISNADDGQGVHGQGRVGVSGWSFVSPGAGVVGASYAITGNVSGVSGYAESETGRGVFGNAEHTDGTNYGVFGQSDSLNGFDLYAGGIGADIGPFTGAHEVRLHGGSLARYQSGLIVSATGETQVRHLPDGGVDLSSTLPTVALADKPEDKAVLGVLVSEVTLPEDHWYEAADCERFAAINALGEGRVWVSDITGDIEAGDYITTSTLPGYGQRQGDDILHNYTLGKAIETVDWDSVTETVDLSGETYKVYLLAVVYTSG